jgi:hypothetical protein
MKQTAVEWLEEEFTKTNYLSEDEFYMKFKQAKEMEREQIINAWDKRGDRIVPKYFLKENITGEQYYNKTFKQQ